MTNLALNFGENWCNNFENLKANFFLADIFIDGASELDINFDTEKLQDLDSELLLS